MINRITADPRSFCLGREQYRRRRFTHKKRERICASLISTRLLRPEEGGAIRLVVVRGALRELLKQDMRDLWRWGSGESTSGFSEAPKVFAPRQGMVRPERHRCHN